MELLRSAPLGIVRFRPDGSITLANPAAARLLAPLAADGAPPNLYDLFAPLIPDLPARVAAHPQAGEVCAPERVSLPGGHRAFSLGINRTEDGLLTAVVQDITAEVERDRRLQADERRFRAIFDNLRDGAICTVGTVGPDGRIDGWNRSLERLGGWQAEDVVGAPLAAVFTRGPSARTGRTPCSPRRGRTGRPRATGGFSARTTRPSGAARPRPPCRGRTGSRAATWSSSAT